MLRADANLAGGNRIHIITIDLPVIVPSPALRVNCIRRWSDLLSRIQPNKIISVVTLARPNVNLQPATIAIEHPAAEIQLHRKVALDDIHISNIHIAAHLIAVHDVWVVKEPELEVIQPVRYAVGVEQPPLIRPRRSHRRRLAELGQADRQA